MLDNCCRSEAIGSQTQSSETSSLHRECRGYYLENGGPSVTSLDNTEESPIAPSVVDNQIASKSYRLEDDVCCVEEGYPEIDHCRRMGICVDDIANLDEAHTFRPHPSSVINTVVSRDEPISRQTAESSVHQLLHRDEHTRAQKILLFPFSEQIGPIKVDDKRFINLVYEDVSLGLGGHTNQSESDIFKSKKSESDLFRSKKSESETEAEVFSESSWEEVKIVLSDRAVLEIANTTVTIINLTEDVKRFCSEVEVNFLNDRISLLQERIKDLEDPRRPIINWLKKLEPYGDPNSLRD